MITANNLQEEINQQINIGFAKEEIEQNLLSKGYTKKLSRIYYLKAIHQQKSTTYYPKPIFPML
jgi:hypothetical protein